MKRSMLILLLSLSCGVFAATNMADTLHDESNVSGSTPPRMVDHGGGYVSSKSDYNDIEKDSVSGSVDGIAEGKIDSAVDDDLN
ncbi:MULTISPECIES: hypothetical protein [Candidatus Ichthyocystis]|uniref:Putative exported protein n=1 Tax=Candidatus Ichthyocystis hellenicum TaxID=1561003 RepID=A0A0S4LZG8_9BURK|nr:MULTISPECIES: hypothetical protein [Ichthyocystis]CUT16894.1 putative exported protein [Candidatus Ichthyocystis hellenicum]